MAATASACAPVRTRPVTEADETLLRRLFAESRDDLALLPDELRGPLVDLQYAARREQYAAAHPGADHLVLELGGLDVGAVLVDHAPDALWLVDLVVARTHRRRGIARAAVTALLDQAASTSRPARLRVWAGNGPARALYTELGFEVVACDGAYLAMAAEPSAPGKA